MQNYIDTCPPKGDNTELREPHSPVPIVLPSGNHSEIVTAKEDVTMEGACTLYARSELPVDLNLFQTEDWFFFIWLFVFCF